MTELLHLHRLRHTGGNTSHIRLAMEQDASQSVHFAVTCADHLRLHPTAARPHVALMLLLAALRSSCGRHCCCTCCCRPQLPLQQHHQVVYAVSDRHHHCVSKLQHSMRLTGAHVSDRYTYTRDTCAMQCSMPLQLHIHYLLAGNRSKNTRSNAAGFPLLQVCAAHLAVD